MEYRAGGRGATVSLNTAWPTFVTLWCWYQLTAVDVAAS
jgi:hypothetical protein